MRVFHRYNLILHPVLAEDRRHNHTALRYRHYLKKPTGAILGPRSSTLSVFRSNIIDTEPVAEPDFAEYHDLY